MIGEEKEKILNTINKIHMRISDQNDIIRNYLLHYGYSDTLISFEKALGENSHNTNTTTNGILNSAPHHSHVFLKERKNLRPLILDGNLELAIETSNKLFPGIFDKFPKALFLLQCQKFIELIRRNSVDEAVEFAQNELSQFTNIQNAEIVDQKLLQDAVALLAYIDPSHSPIAYLLQTSQREMVADELNETILAMHKRPSKSVLEKLLMQLSTTTYVLKTEGQQNYISQFWQQ